MQKTKYTMRTKVWLYPNMAGWHFVSLPKKYSSEISRRFDVLKRGWGSLRIVATIGKTNWKTSIFPDKKSGTYLLPLKADVRKKEKMAAGDTITFTVEIQT